MDHQVNYFFSALRSPLFWGALLGLVGLSVGLLVRLLLTTKKPAPPPDVSLLSPTLATEILGPHAARAWLLAVALDLYAKDLPEDYAIATQLGRQARLRLIHMREERDPEAIPIGRALASCCHTCAELLATPHEERDGLAIALLEEARDTIEGTTI